MNALGNKIIGGGNAAAVRRGEVIPWTLIGAALAAMAALYFSANHFVGLPGLAVLMILSRFTTWRLPRTFIIGYGVRLVILAVTLTLMGQTETQDATVWYLKQADTNLAGYALAADLVLRAWERRDEAGAREGLGVVVLMTAFLLAAATNTYERLHIQLITPIYAILLLLSFRGFALMRQPAARRRSMRANLVLLRGIVICLTIGFAGAAVYVVTRYEYQVENYAMQFLRQHHDTQHEIGLSTAPHLSRVFNPEKSTARILIIDGQPADPHLRVAAFDRYFDKNQDAQWLPPTTDRDFAPMASSDLAATIKAHLLTITRLGDTADLVPAPLGLGAIHCDDPLEQDLSGTIRDSRSASLQPYQVMDALSPTFQGPLAVKPDAMERGVLMTIPPEIDPKVIALAKQVAGDGEQTRQVMRIQEYLRSHHAYSLSFDPQGDPLNDFILNNRAAHCQYFASALVIMARAVGVPARYVIGFYAHEPYGNGRTVVREQDAHAWAECWLDGIGWVTFDATPTGGLPDSLFHDPPAWKRWWEKLGDLPGQIRAWLFNNATLLEELAGGAAVVWLGGWIIRRLWRRQRKPKKQAALFVGPNVQLLEMARRYERWLKAQGMACPPESTWRAHLATRDKGPPDVGQRCANFVKAYDRARFGSDADSAARARELLNEIESDN